jgi:membrane protein required for colicin V production
LFLDIVTLALLVMAVLKGWRKGFVVALFSLFAFIIGLAAALKLSAVVAAHIGGAVNISQRWLPVIAFALVFFVVAYGVNLGARAIEAALRMMLLGWLNRLAGIVFYLLLYFFVFSILLFYVVRLNMIKPGTIQASVCYPYIHPLGPAIINIFGYWSPFFKNIFTELEHFFDTMAGR